MKMISVIIPSYNRGDTIKRAIKSVLEQTYSNLEVIVVDDGSTDNTEKIVAGLKNDKVSYYKNVKNIGACGSRNRGITLAKGEFIAFQDSDDEWLPEKLTKQMLYLNKVNCDLVFCSMDRISAKNIEVYPPYLPDNNSSLFKQLLHENCTSTQTLLGKREVFESIKFDESMPRFQDWEIMLRISSIYSVKHLNEVLVKSYIQNDSISLNSKSAISGLKKIYEIHKEAIIADEKINSEFCIKMAEYMLANGENPKENYKKAFQLNFSIKLFLFYLICSVSLHKFLFKVKQAYFSLR